jgi:hypothetical protein
MTQDMPRGSFEEQLQQQRKLLRSVAQDWVSPWPQALEGKSAETLLRAAGDLDADRGRARLIEALVKAEEWFAAQCEALGSDDAPPDDKWLQQAAARPLDQLSSAMSEVRKAAVALAEFEKEATGDDPDAARARLREDVAKALQRLEQRNEAIEQAAAKLVSEEWSDRTDKPTEEEVRARTAEKEGKVAEARRETAEHMRKAAEKAAESLKEEQSRKANKDKRRWYHWVIDITLVLVALYLIKTRFLDKKSQMVPPPSASPPALASAPGSGHTRPGAPRILINPTRMLAGPGLQFAPVEVLSAPVRAEMLAPPESGWVKVRLGASRQGYVPLDAVVDPSKREKKTDGPAAP